MRGFSKFIVVLLNFICKIYLTVIRGTPVVVQLMIMYFIVLVSSTNKVLVAVLAFGFNSAAYVAEIFRSGIMSIDEGQFEAALANEFIVLLKETSVAGYVGLVDLTKGGDIIRSRTFQAFMPLIGVAVIYLVMVMFFTWLVGILERRLRDSER